MVLSAKFCETYASYNGTDADAIRDALCVLCLDWKYSMCNKNYEDFFWVPCGIYICMYLNDECITNTERTCERTNERTCKRTRVKYEPLNEMSKIANDWNKP